MTQLMRTRTFALALCTAACSAGTRPSATPAAESRLFAMQSNFWVNLHHFLYVTARARRGLDATRPAVTSALADTAGFSALPDSLRVHWTDALAYYDRVIAERDILFDTALVTVNVRLSHVRDDALGRAGLDAELVAALTRAAPAYRAVWWP